MGRIRISVSLFALIFICFGEMYGQVSLPAKRKPAPKTVIIGDGGDDGGGGGGGGGGGSTYPYCGSLTAPTLAWTSLNPGATTGTLSIGWSDVSATIYDLYYRQYPSGGFVWGSNSGSTSGTLTLPMGFTYEYYITARRPCDNGAPTDSRSSATYSYTFPVATPTGLTPSAVTQTSFTASWGSVNTATNYFIDVNTSSGFTGTAILNNASTSGATSKNITGLTPNTTYYYRVRAYNGSTTSTSTAVAAQATLPIPIPAVPVSVQKTTVTTNSIALSWTASTWADNYKVDLSALSDFSNLVYSNTQTNTASISLTGLNSGTTYYARVRATSVAGTSANSSTLTVATFTLPPTNLVTSSVTANSFTFGWTASAGAASYAVDVASSADFTSSVVLNSSSVTSGTSVAVSGLTAGTTYYSRVRAVNAAGASANPTSTSVPTIPATPTAPGTTAVATNSFTATWQKTGAVTHSYVDVSTNSSFTSFVSSNLDAGTNSSYNIAGLTSGSTYYFRVRASNASGTSANVVSSVVTTLPDVPTNLASSSVTQTSFHLSWSAVNGATGYQVDVSSFADFSSGNVLTNSPLSATTTSLDVSSSLVAGTTYYIRLRAVDAAGASANATITVVLPTAVPSGLTFNTATVSSFTAVWQPVNGATHYFVDVSTSTSFSSLIKSNVDAGTTPQLNITGLANATIYYFRVRSSNNAGTSANSSTSAGVTTVTMPVPTNLSVTAASIGTSTFTATWNTVSGATSYSADVSASSTFASGVTTLTSTTPTISFASLSPGTVYYCRVRAVGAGGPSAASSSVNTLTLPSSPTGLNPTLVTTSSFQLNWTQPASATSYRVDIASSSDFSTGVILNNSSVTSGTSVAVSGLTAGKTYYTRVRALNASGTSANAALTVVISTAVPSIINVTSIKATSFTARWQMTGVVAHSYVDVSTDPSFGTLVRSNLDAGALDSLSITALNSATAYYYRVRTGNASGTSANSATSPVIYTLPAAPINPGVDLLTQTSFLAKVDPVTNADSYFLEASTDPNFGTFLPKYNGTIAVLSPSWPVVGLQKQQRYYFRVRATFNSAISAYSTPFPVDTPGDPVSPFTATGGDNVSQFKLDVIPPSPEATALARYVDVPVSLYSGTPNVGVPIYTIKEHGLVLPISLSYNATGHKVDAIAPRTGLGWSLNAGGVVTRVIRGGWPDENDRGFLKLAAQYHNIDAIRNLASQDKLGLYNELAEGCRDAEPDLFYFNFNGYTGQFMYDWDGTIKVLSANSVKIQPTITHPGPNDNPFLGDRITSWTITVDDGTIYTFAATETTRLDDTPIVGADCSYMSTLNSSSAPQSWFMTQMLSANQQAWIQLNYTSYSVVSENWTNFTKVYNEAWALEDQSQKKLTTVYNGMNLSSIRVSSFPTKDRVTFVPGTQARTDVDDGSFQAFPLAAIDIKDGNDKQIDHWDFGYDYSTHRLTLISLTEKSGALSKPPFLFTYDGFLPDRHSNGIDHWGFANGAFDEQSPIPPADEVTVNMPGRLFHIDGGNREPNVNTVTAGMLTGITYPTGGKDKFEFESHRYSFEQNSELIRQVTNPRVEDVSAVGPGRTSVSHTFVVNAETDINVTYAFFFPTYDDPNITPKGNSPALALYDSNGKYVWQITLPITTIINETSGNEIITRIKPGTYTITATSEPALTGGLSTSHLTLAWGEDTGETYTDILAGGGVRIKRITRSFGNGAPDKITRYDYSITEDGATKSSGSLLQSGFRYEDRLEYAVPAFENGASNAYGFVNKTVRYALNRTALGTTMGSHVGYSQVTVLEGENGENGKTIYQYTSPRTVTDFISFDIPYPPPFSLDYQRGLLIDQATFATGSADTLHRVKNDYSSVEEDVPALKIGRIHPGPEVPDVLHMDWFAEGGYSTRLGYTRLEETKERIMNPGEAIVETTQNFTYDEDVHKQLVETSKINSKGETFVTRFKYPLDYTSVPAGIERMKDIHMINTPIEILTWKKLTGSQVGLISGIKTDFAINNQGVVPIAKYGAKITDPIVTSDPFGTVASLYEPRLLLGAYDLFDNVKEVKVPDGQGMSYLWGYKQMLPVARAQNAPANQIFYESFEEVTASTADKKTGAKSKQLTGSAYTISTGLPAVNGNYILSYWVKDGSAAWTYKERLIQNYVGSTAVSTDVVTNGFIDEIRMYPQGALMTTYTYDPLVGMTSETDAANMTTYYEYDDMGRLKLIRDNDKNIIQHIDYKFQSNVTYRTVSDQ